MLEPYRNWFYWTANAALKINLLCYVLGLSQSDSFTEEEGTGAQSLNRNKCSECALLEDLFRTRDFMATIG
jgi:hypothetical protein